MIYILFHGDFGVILSQDILTCVNHVYQNVAESGQNIPKEIRISLRVKKKKIFLFFFFIYFFSIELVGSLK
jgi:hypothetical protein